LANLTPIYFQGTADLVHDLAHPLPLQSSQHYFKSVKWSNLPEAGNSVVNFGGTCDDGEDDDGHHEIKTTFLGMKVFWL
jgi:hypothetical protein